MKSLGLSRTSRAGTWLIATVSLLAIGSALAQRDRITHVLDNYRTAVVPGHLNPMAKAQFDRGAAPTNFALRGMTLTVRRTAAQQKDLKQLLAAQQNPSSAEYHKWLTAEAFASRFGASPSDLATLQQWLESQGFQIRAVARSRTFIRFDATAAQVRSAFGTEIHQYTVNGVKHYANSSEPSLPGTLAPLVLAVGGMNDFGPHPKPAKLAGGSGRVKPRYVDGLSDGMNYLAPGDLATLYDIGPLQTATGVSYGTGQTVVVIGGSAVVPGDLAAYCTTFNLGSFGCTGALTYIYSGSVDPGPTGDQVQAGATMALELVSGVAPGAALVLDADGEADGMWTALSDAVDNHRGQVILMSYGQCETSSDPVTPIAVQSTVQAANALGITVIAASGDMGAAGCDPLGLAGGASGGLAANVPSDIPEVTGVGGTEFIDQTSASWGASNSSTGGTALGYTAEASWDDTSETMVFATGGGVSGVFATPSWQLGTAGVVTTGRNSPDVAFSASQTNGYIGVVTLGGPQETGPFGGGTQASSAVFAGIVALMNASQGTGASAGNINPALYSLGVYPGGYTGADAPFHAIAALNVNNSSNPGGNLVPCVALSTDCPESGLMGYPGASAGTYTQATGLGSVDAFNLQQAWPLPTASISSFSPASAVAGGSAFTLTVNGAAFNPTAVVMWNGKALSTAFGTSAQLTVPVTVGMIASFGSASVAVLNNDGTTSAASSYPIDQTTISSFSPLAATAGAAITLTVNGTGFVSGAQIVFNGTPLTTTLVGNPVTSLTAAATVPGTAGTVPVAVLNGGATASDATSFTINPGPSIASITGIATAGNSTGVALTILGSNFASGYGVAWNGVALSSPSCTTTSCSVTVPGSDLTTHGPASVTVVTADSVSSAPFTFTVNYAPAVSGLSPAAAVINSTATLVTIAGNYFTTGIGTASTVYWTPPPGAATPAGPGTISSGYSSATSMSAILPASYLQTAGTAYIQVVSADGVLSSPATPFTVSPSGSISYLSPSYATIGNPGFTLTVNGSGFVTGAQIAWNGTPLTTTPVGSPVTSLTASIASGRITGTSAQVTVVNADTTTSVARTFTINAAPVIATTSGLSPASTGAGSSDTAVALAGTGFTSRSTVTFTPPGGSTAYPITSAYVSAISMSATVPSDFLSTRGAASMRVVSGDGVSSAAATFTINPTAIITYLSPSHSTAGQSAALPLTVHGSGFVVSATTVSFNGNAQTCTATTTSLIPCSIPKALIVNATSAAITVPVVTADGASSPVNFTINPAPAIGGTSITTNGSPLAPASASVGRTTGTVTLTGTNFTSGSTVTWTPTGSLSGAGTPITLSSLYVGATSMTATVPSTLLTAAGNANLTVVSADGGSSNAYAFAINSVPPTITHLSQSTATAGAQSPVAVTITGTNFTSKSTVTWTPTAPLAGAGTPITLSSSYTSATTLLATVPYADLAAAGTATITVVGANGSSSATTNSTFTINAAPAISGLNPAAATVGGTGSVALTITGTNITTGSTVTWVGKNKTYTLGVSSCTPTTSCTATVPAAYLTTAGLDPITVKTADGVSSNAMNFSVASAAITGFTPNSANIGSSAFLLAVNGTGFVNGAAIVWGTMPMTTAFVSATELTAQIPAVDIPGTAGSVRVAVLNQDGTTSVAVPFTISDYSVPTITSLTPNSVTAGTSSVTITVTGSNFVAPVTTGTGSHASTTPGSQIYVGGSSTGVVTAAKGTTTSITATITGLVNTAGPLPVTVVTTGVAPSASIPLTVIGPSIASVSPSSIPVGSPGATVTVTGANFLALPTGKTPVVESQLCVGGASTGVTVTKGAETSITATIPSTMLTAVGPLSLTVQNTGTGSCPTTPAYIVYVGAPAISSLSPASAAAGLATSKTPLTLTVNGTNFVSGTSASAVYWGAETTPLATVVKSATQLTATVTATELSCCVSGSTTSAGAYNITVKNGSAASSPSTFSVLPPTITSLSPTTAAAAASVKLTVNGTNFVAGSVVTWGTTPLTTKYVNATQLTATATAGSAGGVSVSVQNGTATPLAYGFFDVGSLLPNSASAGSGGLTLTVNGTGFATGAVGKASVVKWGALALTTAYVNATQVTATLPSAQLLSAGATTVTVTTGTVVSTAGTFTVTAPAIALGSTSAVAGSAAFTLTVTGTNFISGTSKVWWGAESSPLATAYVPGSSDGSTPASLTASVTSTELATSGPVNVTVINGAGSTASNIVVFTVNGPTISSLSPTNLVAGSGATITLTVTGTNFVHGAGTTPSTVMWNGVALGTTTYVDASHVTAPIAPAQLLSAGAQSVTVQNGASTAASAASTFTVNLPTITSLSPASKTAAGGSVTLTVTGTNFVSGAGATASTVMWDGTALTTTPVDGTHVTAAVTAGYLTAGVHNVTVKNATAVSTPAALFGVGLAVESLSPASAGAGSAGFTLTVTGTNFVTGGANPSTIMWNGVALGTTTYVSATQLTAPFTTLQLASASAHSITVQNGVSGTPSNGIVFTVGAPTIGSLSATSAAAGAAAFTLTVTGTNFVSGASASTVMWGVTALTTTPVDSTHITAAVTSVQLAAAATPSITVQNGTVVSAQSPTFTVGAPTIASLSQSSAVATDTPFTLTVTGTNFVSGTNASTVMWGATALTTTYVSATQITAAVTTTQLASAATPSITVVNGTATPASTGSTFTVSAAPTVSLLSKTSVTHNTAQFTLTVTGTGFVTGATVMFGSTALVTTYVSGTSLTAIVTTTAIRTAESIHVTVVLPTGATSATGTLNAFRVT